MILGSTTRRSGTTRSVTKLGIQANGALVDIVGKIQLGNTLSDLVKIAAIMDVTEALVP